VAGALSAILWSRLRFRADGVATGVEDGVESEQSEGEGGLDDFRIDEFHPSAGARRAKWGATPPRMRTRFSKDATSLDESHQKDDDSDDDENMDESAHGVTGHETECPEDEENDGEGH
jgi:hypothetical protein